jgi:hypothetical protein
VQSDLEAIIQTWPHLPADVRVKVVEYLRAAVVAVGFTLDTYAHVLPSMGREAANRMERLFNMAT